MKVSSIIQDINGGVHVEKFKKYSKLFYNTFIVFILSCVCLLPVGCFANENETQSNITVNSITFDQTHYIKIEGYIHNLTDEIWCLNEITIAMGDIGDATCYYDEERRKCACYDMYLPAFTKPDTLFGIEYIIESAKKVKIQEYEQKLNQSDIRIEELNKDIDFKNFIIAFAIFIGVFAYLALLALLLWITKIFPNWRWKL